MVWRLVWHKTWSENFHKRQRKNQDFRRELRRNISPRCSLGFIRVWRNFLGTVWDLQCILKYSAQYHCFPSESQTKNWRDRKIYLWVSLFAYWMQRSKEIVGGMKSVNHKSCLIQRNMVRVWKYWKWWPKILPSRIRNGQRVWKLGWGATRRSSW